MEQESIPKHKCACGRNCGCNGKKEFTSGKVTKDMKIVDIVNSKPEAAEMLFEIGLGCAGCHLAIFETLEQGCKGHGMSDKEIDEVVEMLNV